MHNFLMLGIPAGALNGAFDQAAVCAYADSVLGRYVEDKCDYFQIGGRWQGVLGARADNPNVLPAEGGRFEENYDFFNKYSALVNDGANGPFVVENVAYIPINGGLVKDIEWDVPQRFMAYVDYLIPQRILARDPRLGAIPDAFRYHDGNLSAALPDGTLKLLAIGGETFSEYVQRTERALFRDFIPPHAYVDLDGVWHDDNEIWEELQNDLMSGKPMPEDLNEYTSDEFRKRVHAFLDSLRPEDGVVIVDFHV